MSTQKVTFGAAAAAILLAALLPTTSNGAATPDPGNAQAAPAPVVNATFEPTFASGVSEVMKLFKGSVPTDIILNYVNNSPLSFYLTADNVIYLQQQGLPKELLTAMLQHNGDQQRQTAVNRAAVPSQAPAPAYNSYPPENTAANFNDALQARAQAGAAASAYAVAAPAPVYPTYYPSDYGYGYDYDYGYYPYYWPPVTIGFGFGGYGGFGRYGHFGGGAGHFGGGGFGHGGGGGHGGGHR